MIHVFAMGYSGIAALFFLVFGDLAAARPRAFAATLDLEPVSRGGANEIRAQCLFITVGIICALAAIGAVDRQFALGGTGMVFGGVIAGRLFGVVLGLGVTGYGATVRMLILIDGPGCVFAIAAMLADQAAH